MELSRIGRQGHFDITESPPYDRADGWHQLGKRSEKDTSAASVHFTSLYLVLCGICEAVLHLLKVSEHIFLPESNNPRSSCSLSLGTLDRGFNTTVLWSHYAVMDFQGLGYHWG